MPGIVAVIDRHLSWFVGWPRNPDNDPRFVSGSVTGRRAGPASLRHARFMEFSWWIWSALVLLGLVAVGLVARSVVLTVREYGVGRGRMNRGPGAPWFWVGMALTAAAGLLLVIWVVLLDP